MIQPHQLAETAMTFQSAISAMIEALGMTAENEQRKHNGESMAYTKDDFEKIIDSNGLGYNQIIEAGRRINS